MFINNKMKNSFFLQIIYLLTVYRIKNETYFLKLINHLEIICNISIPYRHHLYQIISFFCDFPSKQGAVAYFFVSLVDLVLTWEILEEISFLFNGMMAFIYLFPFSFIIIKT